MANVVVFGIGQLAETISLYLERDSDITVIGYTVDDAYAVAETFRGRPVVPWSQIESVFPPDQSLLFGPVSFRRANRFRRDRFLEGKRRGYSFATFIHPTAQIYGESIGENCLILEQNIVQPRAVIGDNTILWSANHIGHHTHLGDHCFLAGQVGIAGNCRIGEGTFFGGKAGVVDGVRVGEWSIFGFGAIASADVPPNAILDAPSSRVLPGAAERFALRFMA